MSTTWQQRAEQWRRFAHWEARRLREDPPELAESLRWMAAAYEVARQSSPGWVEGDPRARAAHIASVRAALARMVLPA